jgi:hypothetical protein
MNPIGFIYKTTCLCNGKIYIGRHEGADTDTYLGSGELFIKALRKYGKNNFKRDILRYCYTLHELKIWEYFFIKRYKSQNESIGYNIADGDVNSSEYNPAKLPEVRKRMSQSIKKAYMNAELRSKKSNDTKIYFLNNPEARKKLSEINKERFKNPQNHPMYGRKQSKSSNEKNRMSHIGKKMSEETKRKISESVKRMHQRHKQDNDKICK